MAESPPAQAESQDVNSADEAVSAQERKKEIYFAFQKVKDEEWSQAAARSLQNVRVPRGQDPYLAAAMSVLDRGIDVDLDQVRRQAMKKVAQNYALSEAQMLAILTEGDAAHWQQ